MAQTPARRMMPPVPRLVAGAVVLAASWLGLSGAIPAGATTNPPIFYLDVGASVSVGVQPTPLAPNGQRTDQGYSNDLVALEAATGVTLALDEVGCPGESTSTMVFGGDRCYPSPSSQLSTAVAILSAHHDQTGLVTIDLGFNDVMPCIAHTMVDQSCLSRQIGVVREQLTAILSTLRAAAGPHVLFVGVDHYNPYAALIGRGTRGRLLAARRAAAIEDLNAALRDVYGSFSIPVADVAAAFHDYAGTTVHAVDGHTRSDNAARICELTWMCRPAPLAPNIHPNIRGYLVIAQAIKAVLPATW
jgi:lysophospholipase L1-like esterase